jgi:S-adenosylmethionine decarboxylase
MPAGAERAEDRTYTITRDGVHYAGAHLIVDMWGGQRLDDLEHIEATLRKCAEACGATLLHVQLHHFSENNGVTGVAVLAESHITLHTWPEFDYAAFDIFMCGACEPRHAVEVLREALVPERTEVSEHLRGRVGAQRS